MRLSPKERVVVTPREGMMSTLSRTKTRVSRMSLVFAQKQSVEFSASAKITTSYFAIRVPG
jgi:hypothetical protein